MGLRFREFEDDREGQRKCLDFLGVCLRDCDNTDIVYMTGILPVRSIGNYSGGNCSVPGMFSEYSMVCPGLLAAVHAGSSGAVPGMLACIYVI